MPSSERRCDRNRKRSKRRAIYCLVHRCYLDSVSQKYYLYANHPGELQKRGIGKQKAHLLIATKTNVPLNGEWLEAFWCEECQKTEWYRVKKHFATYSVVIASAELWQQAMGVINPEGNPSVGEFTRRHARKRQEFPLLYKR
jgi:hypothetical protein